MLRRTSLKKGQTQLKKTPLKKQNPDTTKKKHEDRLILWEKDEEFYNEVLKEKNSISDLTGNYIPNANRFNCHHLLPKSLYSQFRHEKWNILVCEEVWHNQIELKPTLLPEDLYDKFIECLNYAKKKGGL